VLLLEEELDGGANDDDVLFALELLLLLLLLLEAVFALSVDEAEESHPCCLLPTSTNIAATKPDLYLTCFKTRYFFLSNLTW
jgi:hypothetical protein